VDAFVNGRAAVSIRLVLIAESRCRCAGRASPLAKSENALPFRNNDERQSPARPFDVSNHQVEEDGGTLTEISEKWSALDITTAGSKPRARAGFRIHCGALLPVCWAMFPLTLLWRFIGMGLRIPSLG